MLQQYILTLWSQLKIKRAGQPSWVFLAAILLFPSKRTDLVAPL